MKSRNISLVAAMEDIIARCSYCSMGMVDKDNKPYVLHMNFGYEDGVLYLHSAPKGKKIDVLQNNNNVCLAFSTDHVLEHQNADVACSYSMKYRSVLVFGKTEFIDDLSEKRQILNLIMKQYTGRCDYEYSDPAAKSVTVYKVIIEKMEGRAYGY
ncbi:MAG: pyridoxamine 5'-phosphate oxidase family protein [Bacteroidales bacterium]|jgi:nitroimidazol reductase NimA-like FMN-containing flavoprotein (pyridoxamine 5'-phosphate oxidase superfamily)|nr:pyridoxamine 5'-phosphate oxidase family protein [Bacteroidales bacterium]